jgi:hypothetical protein
MKIENRNTRIIQLLNGVGQATGYSSWFNLFEIFGRRSALNLRMNCFWVLYGNK